MMLNQRRTIHGLMGLLAFLLSGCGQSLSIRVDRIAKVDESLIPPGALVSPDQRELYVIRGAIAKMADLTIEAADQISNLKVFTGSTTNDPHTIRVKAEQDRTELLDDSTVLSVGELRRRAEDAKKTLERFLEFADSDATHKSLNLTDSQSAGLKGLVPDIRKKVGQSAKLFASVEMRLSGLLYGGYRSESVYLLNPGSEAYEKLVGQGGTARSTMVFNHIEALATGDSVLLAVQESPAYFTMRYVSADPTDVIRNMLIATNRVLRVAAAFVPMLSGVNGALGMEAPAPGATTQPSTSGTEESATPSAAEEAIKVYDEGLRQVLSNSKLVAVIAKITANPQADLSDPDKATLIAMVKALEAALGSKQ